MEMNEGVTPETPFMDQIKALLESCDGPSFIPTGFGLDRIPEGGFKRGELLSLFARLNPDPYPKTNFMFHMVLRRMKEDPTYKPVFRFSLEQSLEHFDEDRFKQSVEAMGLTYTNPSEKEKKQ